MTVTNASRSSSTVIELTVEQARSMFDERCREELGVSAAEFLARIESNDIPDEWPMDAVARLEILLPFAR
jgi:hypothetical protein